MKNFFRNVRFFWLTLIFLEINEVLAVGEGGVSGVLTNPLKKESITGVLTSISDFLIVLGAPLLLIAITIGGFMILTAGGDPAKIKKGKDAILWACIGYAIVLSAWGIIAIIEQTLNVK